MIDRSIGLIAMMEFELLRSFVAVAECKGFHRAAEQLNLTQSTVSQQIKRLELETKRPLFRRTTRTVALTDDGEMLLGDARRLLQLEEAARRRLISGQVRIGRALRLDIAIQDRENFALRRRSDLRPGAACKGPSRPP
jgi:DNA-binding transcriptional LysR family regulator